MMVVVVVGKRMGHVAKFTTRSGLHVVKKIQIKWGFWIDGLGLRHEDTMHTMSCSCLFQPSGKIHPFSIYNIFKRQVCRKYYVLRIERAW